MAFSIELTNADLEIVKAIKEAKQKQFDLNEEIKQVYKENNMFKGDVKKADKNDKLKELNYNSTIQTMKIVSLNEALAERIIGKVQDETSNNV